jgi:hypothetical protein
MGQGKQHELLIAARWDTSVFTEVGGSRADVLTAKVIPSGDRTHPVEKPTSLLAHIVEPTTEPGALLLDPFAGSGSTLLAARISGRRAVGIEGEERYCELAAKRLDQGVLDFEVALCAPARMRYGKRHDWMESVN